MRALAVLLVLLVLAVPAAARADESVLLVDGTMVSPLAEKGTVADSFGHGAEMRVLFRGEPMTMFVGGFYAIGAPADGKQMRDIYDFHFDWGWNFRKAREKPSVMPFLAIGLDVLNITTRIPKGATHRGTTLGVNARFGAQGWVTKKVFWSVSAQYLGAVVPGTGDDLGGLVLQAGLGLTL